MKHINIPIKTNDINKYHLIINLLKPIPPFNRLRQRELEVLAELFRIYEKYKNIPEKSRDLLIFSEDSKHEICSRLKIKITNYYNIVGPLKEENIILGEKKKLSLNKKYTTLVDDLETLTFKFKNE